MAPLVGDLRPQVVVVVDEETLVDEPYRRAAGTEEEKPATSEVRRLAMNPATAQRRSRRGHVTASAGSSTDR